MSVGVIAAGSVISGGGGSAYAAAVLADAPLLYLRQGDALGSGVAADSSGNGRDLTATGVTFGTTGLVTGDTDTAATFPNSNSTIERIAAASWMNVANVTLEAIIKPADVTAYQSIVIRDLDGGGSSSSWRLRIGGSKLEIVVWTSVGGLAVLTGSTTLVAANKYHVVGKYDGSNLKLLLNGVPDGTAAKTGTLNAAYDITVGKLGQAAGTQEPFNGVIDEVAVYGIALSDARVAAHYAAA